jgi:hypothetical protein
LSVEEFSDAELKETFFKVSVMVFKPFLTSATWQD